MKKKLLMYLILGMIMLSQVHVYGQKSKNHLSPQVNYKGAEIKALPIVTKNSPDIPLMSSNAGYAVVSPDLYFSDPTPYYSFPRVNVTGFSMKKKQEGFYTDAGAFWYSDDEGESYVGTGKGPNVKYALGHSSVTVDPDGEVFIGFSSLEINKSANPKIPDDTTLVYNVLHKNGGGAIGEIKKLSFSGSRDIPRFQACSDWNQDSPNYKDTYIAYTSYRNSDGKGEVLIARYNKDKEKWHSGISISKGLDDKYFSDGVDITVGPGGNLFGVWSVYNNYPCQESGIGFTMYSPDKGFTNKKVIIDSLSGMRYWEFFTKPFNVHSYPSIAVDNSNGENRGTIYVCFSNVGYPAAPYGGTSDIYIIKSKDNGVTWSKPIRVNSEFGLNGHMQFFPDIACDSKTGDLSVVFYDDRNCTGSFMETWSAVSQDGGDHWVDFCVSDVSFRPTTFCSSIQKNLFTSRTSIVARDGRVIPAWTDNRKSLKTYTSPFQISKTQRPKNLKAKLISFREGIYELSWEYKKTDFFDKFRIYANDVLIDSCYTSPKKIKLTSHEKYRIKVTAVLLDGSESGPSIADLQFGNPDLYVYPNEIEVTMARGMDCKEDLEIRNVGQIKTIAYVVNERDKARVNYCSAKGGGGEFISHVEIANVSQSSEYLGYNYYDKSKIFLQSGKTYPITVETITDEDQDRVIVWMDWNADGIFAEEGNEKIELTKQRNDESFSGEITVPEDVKNELATRMRVRLFYKVDKGPCGNTDYGEVEDYPLFINEWMNYKFTKSMIYPSNTVYTKLLLDASSVNVGDYKTTLDFYSEDPDESKISVPVVLHVVENPFPLTLNADKREVCKGSPVQLSLELEDAENCTFKWSNSLYDFDSDEQNPVINPMGSANYYVEVEKEGKIAKGSIYIQIIDAYPVDLIDDPVFCPSHEYELDAGTYPKATYKWSTGETTPVIKIKSEGKKFKNYSVEVTHPKGCVSKDHVKVLWDESACVGLDEAIVKNGFEIYPNPSDRVIYITVFSSLSGDLEMNIFNLHGNLLLHKEHLSPGEENKIDISSLLPGIYTVYIGNEDNYSYKKLIVK
ncbi:MAG: GEVED domain-containing protein [Bacteroidales bacterium]